MSRQPKNEPQNGGMGARKLSMILLSIVLAVVAGCSTAMSIHFHEPKYFEYGVGGVFTTLLLIALLGYPIED